MFVSASLSGENSCLRSGNGRLRLGSLPAPNRPGTLSASRTDSQPADDDGGWIVEGLLTAVHGKKVIAFPLLTSLAIWA